MRSSSDTGLLLAIESSCDETAAAVVDAQLHVRSSIIAAQTDLHARFGGVVPEIASRAHLSQILPVIDEALRVAQARPEDLAGLAVVTQPGLVGSLLVGLTAAKTLAFAWNLPLVGVHHLEAHLYACRMAAGRDVFPAVGFVVSGGHSNLYDCRGPLEAEMLGGTIDDAAGEAFDKVSSLLGLGYPGGPYIEAAAKSGNPRAYEFPRAFYHDRRLEFSFSGLKTAVLYAAAGRPVPSLDPRTLSPERIADLAASFQAAVVDVLVRKCEQALDQTGRRTLLVGGGVAANGCLRQALTDMAARRGIDIVVAPLSLCTDNAAMAAVGWEALRAGRLLSLDADVTPGLIRPGKQRA